MKPLDIVYACIYNVCMLLYEVIDAIEKEKLRYAIVGGYALALHGIVRATMDVDLVLRLKLKDFEKIEATFKSIGLTSRLPIRAEDIIKMRIEYIENRNLIAWSFVDYKNPSRQVDVLVNHDVEDLEVQKLSVAGRKISVASLKELKRMKQLSDRPQDRIDVENIKKRLSEEK